MQFRNDKYTALRLYKLSDKFVSSLTEVTGGYLHPDRLDLFIQIVEDELKKHYFTYSSEGNFLRILNAVFDKTAFIHNCISSPHYIENLILISSNSNYLSDILVRNPEYFYWIADPSNLNTQLEENSFEKDVNNSLSTFKTFEIKVNALRRIKRKEILRIALNDLLGNRSLEETTASLSIIAKILSRVLFELCYKEVLFKYNIEKIESSYCLAALGKLGGEELNYSSDIDLILFFDKNIKSGNKEYFEILSEAAQLFIQKASIMTESGYLFRVDFRLRPDGRNSLICRTLQDYLSYYESRGEDWERQMLIKCSFCGGNIDLYKQFTNYLMPFIYPSSFLISPLEQVIRLKSTIEKSVNEENIKLFSGGIRDIEFSVQALQLLNGGHIKDLRTGSTIKAIKKLLDYNLLTSKEASTFLEAYILYRKIEHFLQLMNDKQTHTIPGHGEELNKLSFYLDFPTSTVFKSHIAELKKKVRMIYKSIVGLEETDYYSDINFENKTKADGDLLFLRTGKGILAEKTFDKNTIDCFNIIEKSLFKYLKLSGDPDKTLRNFVRVIRNVNFPGQWYSSFTEIKFFYQFLDLCTYSQKSIDIFAEDPDLREFFITKKVFEKINPSKLKSYSLKQILFVLSAQFVLKIINDDVVSTTLSTFLSSRISDLAESENIKLSYSIAGAGSLGSSEMNFSSDIDLLFICKEEKDLPELQKKFQTLLNKIKQELKPFNADCRLRPEGKSSYLVWNVDSQIKYIKSRARIWELQSLSKLKFICGEKDLIKQINNAIISRLNVENADNIKKELLEMRKKQYTGGVLNTNIIDIKKDKGGFLDIEYMMQYFLLIRPDLYKKLQGKKFSSALTALKDLNNDEEFTTIDVNYHYMKKILLLNQCIFNSAGYKLSFEKNKLKILSHLIKPEEKIKDKLLLMFRINNFMFKKYTGTN